MNFWKVYPVYRSFCNNEKPDHPVKEPAWSAVLRSDAKPQVLDLATDGSEMNAYGPLRSLLVPQAPMQLLAVVGPAVHQQLHHLSLRGRELI